MGWRIKGTYITNCDCRLVCPCPMNGPPTGANGECHGVVVFRIADGRLGDLSLEGVTFGFYNVFPSALLSGKWKIQLMIDDQASTEQAEAIERIFTGQEGGFFADFVPLVGEVRATERVSITFVDGSQPSASIGATSTLGFEPSVGQSGAVTTIKDAPLGFSPEYKIGRGSGDTNGPFGSFEHVYGETAEFDFS